MKQLIYRSQPFGFDNAMLAGILMQARRNNKQGGITGALICRQDLYLQLIEGPDPAIDTLYAKICEDDRHANVQTALAEQVDERMFPEWDMLDDEMPTLTWSREEIAAGAIEQSSPDTLRAVFARIADKARTQGAPT
ncbi:MAG: BLUF domain-containing protein [Pseudomonadota bacterium]